MDVIFYFFQTHVFISLFMVSDNALNNSQLVQIRISRTEYFVFQQSTQKIKLLFVLKVNKYAKKVGQKPKINAKKHSYDMMMQI